MPFSRIVHKALGGRPSRRRHPSPIPLDKSTYTQAAGEDDFFSGSMDVNFAPGCEPDREVRVSLLIDAPNPAEPSTANLVGAGSVEDDETGGALTMHLGLGLHEISGARFQPAAATNHTLTLLAELDCKSGAGATVSNVAVDVSGSSMKRLARRLRRHLTYANVIATVTAFVVLVGGTAFAANQLAKNSVGKKQLKANAVTTAKIKKNAITTAKIRADAVDGTKVKAGSLGGPDFQLDAMPYTRIVEELEDAPPISRCPSPSNRSSPAALGQLYPAAGSGRFIHRGDRRHLPARLPGKTRRGQLPADGRPRRIRHRKI